MDRKPKEEMGDIKRIAVLENIVEATMLEGMLKEQDIPHVITSYHDSAYDGLFQNQMGWGHIEAPEGNESEILELLDNIRDREEEDSQ